MNKLMHKPRILLHSMTFLRDFGFIYCLSKILERMGCETILASNTNYISYPIKLWSPDVIFYVTVGRTPTLIEQYPKAKLILWNAESCRFDTCPPLELEIIASESHYFTISKVFLWGVKSKDIIWEYAEKNNWGWIIRNRKLFDEKLVVSGHPRIDLARCVKTPKQNKKVKIGFVGLCAAINNSKFSIPELLFNTEYMDNKEKTSQELCFQIRYFEIIHKLIKTFDSQKYDFSLRPYFLENLKNYHKVEPVKNKILQLDNSIEFTSWIKQLDIIIGAVSTTQYLVIAANKTFISLDIMLNRPKERIPFANEYLSAIPNNCPKDFGELVYMIENYEKYRMSFDSNEVISKQYKNFLSAPTQQSTLVTMASEILKVASENQQEHKYPTTLCKFLNNSFIRYAEFRSIKSKEYDYSHFNPSILKKAELEFKSVLEELYKEIPKC